MRMSASLRLRSAALTLAAIFGVIALTIAVGYLVPRQPLVALGLASAVFALGLTLAQPMALPLLAMPVIVVVARVGFGDITVSISDAALAVAFWPALLLGKRPYTYELRMLLLLNAIYQFATLFTLVVNPYAANVLEWFHAWMLVSGALIVGWALGRDGLARTAINLFMAAAGLIGLLTILQGIAQLTAGNLDPVFLDVPFPMHKNFVGTLMGLAAVVAYVRPPWLGWHPTWSRVAFAGAVVAIAFTQSRQAMLGLAVTLVLMVLRSDPHHRRSKFAVALVGTLVAVVGSMVLDQWDSYSRFNSLFQRIEWFSVSWDIWSTDPWFGVGLRWWYTDRFSVAFQPPNAEVEVLTSTGVVGLAAFLVLNLGAIAVVLRMDRAYGTLAAMMLITRFVQAQFDLYWAAVQAAVPFLIVGICLGAHGKALADAAAARRTGQPAEHVGAAAP